MIITLVRHAEVIQKYQGKYNGHIDIGLSQNGKEQAKELGKKLSHIKFDKIYCSDLLRAKETLAAFELNQELIYTERLREKSWGRHEGKSFEEIEVEGIKYENFEQWIRALDGEDVDIYRDKIKEYFYETVFKQDAQKILIVSHSGSIKTLLAILFDFPLEEAFSISLPYSSYINMQKVDSRWRYNISNFHLL